jgi:hypothetical protein
MDTCGAVFRRHGGGSEEQNEPAAREKLAAAVERFQMLLGPCNEAPFDLGARRRRPCRGAPLPSPPASEARAVCGQDVGRWGEGGSKVYAAQMITMMMMVFDFLFRQEQSKDIILSFQCGCFIEGCVIAEMKTLGAFRTEQLPDDGEGTSDDSDGEGRASAQQCANI